MSWGEGWGMLELGSRHVFPIGFHAYILSKRDTMSATQPLLRQDEFVSMPSNAC